jgi:hypothetical protein
VGAALAVTGVAVLFAAVPVHAASENDAPVPYGCVNFQGCTPPNVTTTTSSSSTTTAATTTTLKVLGESVEQNPPAAKAAVQSNSDLPFTGIEVGALVVLGGGLIAGGVALSLAARRKVHTP